GKCLSMPLSNTVDAGESFPLSLCLYLTKLHNFLHAVLNGNLHINLEDSQNP
ncbi:33480_t:CDS:2, partial [Racocetra persica]